MRLKACTDSLADIAAYFRKQKMRESASVCDEAVAELTVLRRRVAVLTEERAALVDDVRKRIDRALNAITDDDVGNHRDGSAVSEGAMWNACERAVTRALGEFKAARSATDEMNKGFEAMAREWIFNAPLDDMEAIEPLAALLARVDRERAEADCKAVCKYCREPKWKNPDTGESGSYSKPMKLSDGRLAHLTSGAPPRTCAASAIRSTLAREEETRV